MSQNRPIDLVTGAFSYSGAQIAERLLDSGRGVRTLTNHPDRPHPLRASIDALEYRFDDPAALARSLEGVSTLYNTFWVRFDHGKTTFANAIECSRMLFFAARRAEVERIVHLSITNPSLESPLPYFRGKALVEYALAQSGVPYSIVRPTWIFGGDRDVLANNIAWILRRMPAFALPGDGAYPVQPVHIDDLARICTDAGRATGDIVIDAAGPETMPFRDLVALVRAAVGTSSPILHIPAPVMAAAARVLGLLVRDVVLTGDEIRGLMAGLLVSHEPPLGQIAFSQWLNEHSTSVGSSYANELQRHFATAAKRRMTFTPPTPTPPTRAVDPPAGHVRTPHAMICAGFWAWAGLGAITALSLDLGPFVALPALVLIGVALATVGDRHRGSAFGMVTGAGLPLLWVAYLQRQGPGTTCWHTASSAGCDQHLNPLPWLIVGVTLMLTGLIAQTRHNQQATFGR